MQQDVWIQALVAFEHLGTNGNGASAGCIAQGAGISNGSVTLNVNWVITAVLSLKDEFLKWPDAIQRKKIARWFLNEHWIPNVIGVVDGTHIHLSQKPAINGEVYYTQKGCYWINAQIVCNYIKTITYCLVGWPGSVFDQTVFSQSSLSKQTEHYFSKGEFLLGNSGYTGTPQMLTPYCNPRAKLPDNREFNLFFLKPG